MIVRGIYFPDDRDEMGSDLGFWEEQAEEALSRARVDYLRALDKVKEMREITQIFGHIASIRQYRKKND